MLHWGEELPKIASGGTPLSDIADMPDSRASLGLGGCQHEPGSEIP